MTIGSRIAKKRKELGLSQEGLGEQLGVSRQSVYRWEKDSAVPELEKLVALSHLFGVSVGWLLGEDTADGEMTDDQLHMVGEITGRYLAAHQQKKRRWPWIAGGAAVIVIALLSAMLIRFGGHISALDANLGALRETVDGLNQSVDALPGELESYVDALLPPEEPVEEEPEYDPYDPANWSIPVIYITGDSLTDWGDKTDVRDAVLSYTEGGEEIFSTAITIKPQGSSSLYYDKKNFTIKLDTGVTLVDRWGEQSKYCLKANYIDPTHAGNVVSAQLAGEMNSYYGVLTDAPNNGSIDGFPCWVVLNGEPAGLYCWDIPKDAWMFGMDEDNPDHIVMCGEGWTDATLFWTSEFTWEDWSVEAGPEDEATREKFQRLMDFVTNTSDEEFVAHFEEYLDLDACLNYFCFASVSNAVDNMGNNMLLVTYDGEIWAPALYDLDSLWGIKWDGLALECSGTAFYTDSYLWQRLQALFYPELAARYAELREDILSEEHIWEVFESFTASIPAEAYELDSELWNPDGHLIRTLPLMKLCVEHYLPSVDWAFEYNIEE